MELKKTRKANLENKRGVFLQIGFVTALAFCLIAFEWTSNQNEKFENNFMTEVVFNEEQIISTIQDEPKVIPPPPVFIPEILIVSDDIIEEIPDLIIDDVEPSDDGWYPETYEIDDKPVNNDPPIPFVLIEDKPKFNNGGIENFLDFVYSEIKYPAIAIENQIQGRVYVEFIIDKYGELTNIKVVRSVDKSLDEEVLRVIKLSPKWIPGKQRGNPVNVTVSLPVIFKIK